MLTMALRSMAAGVLAASSSTKLGARIPSSNDMSAMEDAFPIPPIAPMADMSSEEGMRATNSVLEEAAKTPVAIE